MPLLCFGCCRWLPASGSMLLLLLMHAAAVHTESEARALLATVLRPMGTGTCSGRWPQQLACSASQCIEQTISPYRA